MTPADIAAESVPGIDAPIPLVSWHPKAPLSASTAVLACPPLGEEMNKTRHMIAAQARALAAMGVHVFVPDYFGTGDSTGELADARWATWFRECQLLIRQLRERGAQRLVLWGVRSGCLLAAQAVVEDESRIDGVLFWQPVHAGKQFVTQQLRLLAAASNLRTDGRQTLSDIREELSERGSLEVGGYRWPAPLLADIETQELSGIAEVDLPLALLEVSQKESPELVPLSRRLIDQRRAGGRISIERAVLGDSFWATQELGFAEQLVRATVDAVGELGFTGPSIAPGGSSLAALAHPVLENEGERFVLWDCADSSLLGVLHEARSPQRSRLGVVIVVGGPQYRVGSHRQFVFLARALAGAGFPTLRFDYRGMGDADGELRGFLYTQQDIKSAIDTLLREEPQLESVVLWGLCDAATASMRVAAVDSRVAASVMVNPWVYSERGAAQARITHYYARKLLSGKFWKKLIRGELRVKDSATGFLQTISSMVGIQADGEREQPGKDARAEVSQTGDLTTLLADAARAFNRPTLLVLSGNDLTAAEFEQGMARDDALAVAFSQPQVTCQKMPECDHTFSNAVWRKELEETTVRFLQDVG